MSIFISLLTRHIYSDEIVLFSSLNVIYNGYLFSSALFFPLFYDCTADCTLSQVEDVIHSRSFVLSVPSRDLSFRTGVKKIIGE